MPQLAACPAARLLLGRGDLLAHRLGPLWIVSRGTPREASAPAILLQLLDIILALADRDHGLHKLLHARLQLRHCCLQLRALGRLVHKRHQRLHLHREGLLDNGVATNEVGLDVLVLRLRRQPLVLERLFVVVVVPVSHHGISTPAVLGPCGRPAFVPAARFVASRSARAKRRCVRQGQEDLQQRVDHDPEVEGSSRRRCEHALLVLCQACLLNEPPPCRSHRQSALLLVQLALGVPEADDPRLHVLVRLPVEDFEEVAHDLASAQRRWRPNALEHCQQLVDAAHEVRGSPVVCVVIPFAPANRAQLLEVDGLSQRAGVARQPADHARRPGERHVEVHPFQPDGHLAAIAPPARGVAIPCRNARQILVSSADTTPTRLPAPTVCRSPGRMPSTGGSCHCSATTVAPTAPVAEGPAFEA